MNDNVRKIFDMLGVEPNEEFKIEGLSKTFYINEDLLLFNAETHSAWSNTFRHLLNGNRKIIKIPKEPKKKKLRDLTVEEYKKWFVKNCSSDLDCKDCIFNNVMCPMDNQCWVNHKYLYSDAFLNKEIEVEE